MAVVDQETVLYPICSMEEISENNPKETIRNKADGGLKNEVPLNKVKKKMSLRVFCNYIHLNCFIFSRHFSVEKNLPPWGGR